MTEDCHIEPIVSILSKSGKINKILHPNIHNYRSIAEIYTTEVARDIDPGWRLHKDASMYLALMSGSVKIQIESGDVINSIVMDSSLDNLVFIPARTWFNFIGLDLLSIMLCMSSIPHDPDEIERK